MANHPGMLTLDELGAAVAAGEIDSVIVAICDMQGRLVGKRVRAPHFLQHCASHGIHLCTYLLGTDMEMSTPAGYAAMDWASGYGDYLALPDISTLRRIPWLEGSALVIGDVLDDTTREPVAFSPRRMLQRQVERLAALGLVPQMATELEFYVLDRSYEAIAAAHWAELRPFGTYNEDYQLLQGSKAEPLHRRLRNELAGAGIPIEFSKGEAAAGQHEINVTYGRAVESADRATLFKHGAKEIAHQQGLAITFMAKPDATWTGSSGHIHLSLTHQDGSSAFLATDGGMNETMRRFLAGMIAGARDLSLLMASTINAYKRFASASWAPVHLVWGIDNRTCAFRVVGSGQGLRIENRLPGADGNPYLAFAAVLAAGIDGLERDLDPGEAFQGNGYTATGLPRIPASLREAIACWESSELARRAFGDDVHAHYLNMGHVEQSAFDMAVTTWERQRYLERG